MTKNEFRERLVFVRAAVREILGLICGGFVDVRDVHSQKNKCSGSINQTIHRFGFRTLQYNVLTISQMLMSNSET